MNSKKTPFQQEVQKLERNNLAMSYRERVAIADVNAGATLLPAVRGYKYRLHDFMVVAIGGAATTGTAVTILGTQSGSAVTLASFAQANLTRSTPLYAGITGCTILADGGSFTEMDVETAITIAKTGSSFAGATHIDVLLTYELVKA